MIHYITGTLERTLPDSIVVDNNGIGYLIRVPGSVLDSLPKAGSEVRIYTYMHVREDLMQLFGFLTEDALDLFQLLITVNGIGPKGGLAILSIMTPDELRFAVMADDAKTIAKTPGIGAKTAGKLILELKDKLKWTEVVESALDQGEQKLTGAGDDGEYGQMISDAVEALTALGYSATQAMKAVRGVDKSTVSSVEELLKYSLKNM